MALIEVEVEGRLGTLTFNRPEKLNALSPQMFEGFVDSFRGLVADKDVRVIIIKGSGRAFSVGFDVDTDSEAKRGNERVTAYEDWVGLRAIVDRWLEVWRAPKPVIAAVHGYCMGLATQLAVCCDLTVVARDAVIGWPSLPLGGGLLAPVSSWLIGPKKAKELSYIAGSRISGEEALQLGWANYAVDAAEVVPRARELAERIAKTPPDLLHVKKLAMNRIMDVQGFAEAVTFGAEWDAIAHDSPGQLFITEYVKELGIKGAIDWFEREG
ncbi:MAG: enoyl-CoA hydratase/isomerase family protein [Gaiellales bacterium]